MLNMQQHNILEGILDATFGKGSMQEKTGHALRHKIGTNGDGRIMLEIRYERGVNFNPLDGIQSQKKTLDKDSFNAIGDKIAEVKKLFREESETTLKVKALSDGTSDVTPISMNRTLVRARYRANVVYEISV
tara:strand:- start:1726 stop:2121 length:396 start_codon:yes stop_codon:yes gene_type:complete